jgi:hypothetical protein
MASCLLACQMATGWANAPAKPSEPQPSSWVGQRWIPDDVDWAHPIYATDFDSVDALKDWRLEGGHDMRVEGGKLILTSALGGEKPAADDNHLVCWLTRDAPADFLVEFQVCPEHRDRGLNIIFFNARGLRGESIFDPALAPRHGLFRQYHSGDLNNYHISYWASDRGTVNVRKNAGFRLVATGRDLVGAAPAGTFQTIRLYKRGGIIRLMVDDVVSVAFDDDGKTHGPVWSHSGWIGLRQMAHTERCAYEYFKMFPLKP